MTFASLLASILSKSEANTITIKEKLLDQTSPLFFYFSFLL